jgi:hypothetical protein
MTHFDLFPLGISFECHHCISRGIIGLHTDSRKIDWKITSPSLMSTRSAPTDIDIIYIYKHILKIYNPILFN